MKIFLSLRSHPPSFLFFLALAFVLIFLAYTNDFSLQSFLPTCRPRVSDSSIKRSSEKTDFRLLIGVFSVADSYQRRQLIRDAYWHQSGDYSNVEVNIRFVICNVSKEEELILVGLEIMRYDDIIILDCIENMDSGKTYEYFSSLPAMLGDHPYDYVMKCDDDTYLRLGNLVESLRSKPREDVYYGLAVPCETTEDSVDFTNNTYMSGMGYLISWDLVEWIAHHDTIKNQTDGAEDLLLATWLNEGNKGKNRFNNRPMMYDYKGELYEFCFRHDFIPETIAVHQLKDDLKWARTLKYFNVTKELKSSNWYHIS